MKLGDLGEAQLPGHAGPFHQSLHLRGWQRAGGSPEGGTHRHALRGQPLRQFRRCVEAALGKTGAVLDPVDLGLNTLLHRRDGVRVRDDGQADAVRLLDDDPQFFQRELAGEYVGPDRHQATTGHDLDEVRTPLTALAHRPAKFVSAGSLSSHRRAVTPNRRDRRPGRHDGGTVADGTPPLDDRPVDVAEIPHRRDARSELRPHRRGDDDIELPGTQLG